MKLTKDITKYIETKYNGYVVNVIAASKSGVPDLLACIEGKFYGFELKTKNDRLSTLQKHNIDRIIKAGGKAGEVRTVKDIDNIISNNLSINKVTYKKVQL